jgi:outer membrane protein insertion porin family
MTPLERASKVFFGQLCVVRSLGVFLALTLLSSSLLGQGNQPTDQRIEEIRIVGNRRIPESTVRYYIQSKEDLIYDEQQALRDYNTLLNTNFFADAKIKRMEGESGVILIFEFVERPLVRTVEYEGMKSFKESDVLERFRDMRVGLSVDSQFDPANLPKARRAIKMLLDQNGRPLGRVEVITETITATSQKIIFKIDEGPKVRIGDIGFEGNTVFTDDELRGALDLTKERSLMTIFKGTDKFIEEKLEYDLGVNLMEKYREVGYLFARAGTPEVKIVEGRRPGLIGFRKTKQQYYLTIPISEGEQYFWNSFEVEGITNMDQGAVKASFGIIPGQVVNYTALKAASDALKEMYSTTGYLDMTVVPDMDTDQENLTVDGTIRVTEGKQYIVHRIDFGGNTKTRDKVIRREFFLEEQQLFNGGLLDFSILRINQLGFFEPIEEKDYEVIKRAPEGEVDILVSLKEKNQQSIGLSGGISGISGSFIGINYSSTNFRGLGQRIDVNLTTGTRTSNYMFSFTEPYFLDSKISMGASIFNQRLRFDTFAFTGGFVPDTNTTLYTQVTNGFSLTTSYPMFRWARTGLAYSLQRIKIDDLDESFTDFALNQLVGFTPGGSPEDAGNGIIRSEIKPSIQYNTKNQVFNATQGTMISFEMPIAGGPLGGDFNLIRPFVEFQRFIPDRLISKGRNTLAFRAQVNHIIPYGKLPNGDPMTAPFFERIFVGGEFTLRGFDIRSVAPWAITQSASVDNLGNPTIDPATGLPLITESAIPVGGDTSLVTTVEYRMPIFGPLQVSGFFDFGTSTSIRQANLRVFGPSTNVILQENTNGVWRASTGAEVQFLLPVVNQPFRLIFAYNPLILDTSIVSNGRRFFLREPRSGVKFTVGYTF